MLEWKNQGNVNVERQEHNNILIKKGKGDKRGWELLKLRYKTS